MLTVAKVLFQLALALWVGAIVVVSFVVAPAVQTTVDVLRVRPELAPYVAEIESTVAEIERLGGQFKGIDLGLVDFRGEIDGRPVLLCWQYGEKSIGFWHAIDEGFSGRQPLLTASTTPLQ